MRTRCSAVGVEETRARREIRRMTRVGLKKMTAILTVCVDFRSKEGIQSKEINISSGLWSKFRESVSVVNLLLA
jgi:hypothetical protein